MNCISAPDAENLNSNGSKAGTVIGKNTAEPSQDDNNEVGNVDNNLPRLKATLEQAFVLSNNSKTTIENPSK